MDYRNLNKIIATIPRIDDLIDELNDAKFLTKIDFNKRFLQIPVNSKDRPQRQRFKPRGVNSNLPECHLGLAIYMNAPATFQCSMNRVLQGLEQFLKLLHR